MSEQKTENQEKSLKKVLQIIIKQLNVCTFAKNLTL